MDHFHSLAGPYCLAREDTQEAAPSGVMNAFVEARLAAGPVMQIAAILIRNRYGTAAQVGRLDSLHIDHVVLANEHQCRFVVKVRALPADMLVFLRALGHDLLAASTALLAAGDALVRLGKLPFGFPVLARILYHVAVRRNEKDLQSNVYPGHSAG